MYEVFNTQTGETIGYSMYEARARYRCWQLGQRGVSADYINADTESSTSHLKDCCDPLKNRCPWCWRGFPRG